MPSLPPQTDKCQYYIRDITTDRRPPVKISMGFTVPWTQPHPDPACPLTTLTGVRKRMASDPPEPNPEKLELFRYHVAQFIRKHFVPLDCGSDYSFETWISNCPYPLWRKDELRRVYLNMEPWLDKYAFLKCFMKDESYPEYKRPRGIYSRTDEYKVLVGPTFQLISEQLFKKPQTIKKVPISDRPAEINKRLNWNHCRVFETDYTSFEASFTITVQEACELQFYEYMTQNLPNHKEFMLLLKRGILKKKQRCIFRDFDVYMPPKRFSGEMNTSLGNTFTNWVIMDFLCAQNGAEYQMIVEGDDGLTKIIGPPPTEAQAAELGFIMKLIEHRDINLASFCGLIFHPDVGHNITNPIEVIAEYGWTRQRYWNANHGVLMGLQKAKALSLLYQYPGCPILSVLAEKTLNILKDYDYKFDYVDSYSEQLRQEVMNNLDKIVKVPIDIRTRLLMEEKFGITVMDQLSIEKEIGDMSLSEGLRIPSADKYVPALWRDYYTKYSVAVILDPLLVNRPPGLWQSIPELDILKETLPNGWKGIYS